MFALTQGILFTKHLHYKQFLFAPIPSVFRWIKERMLKVMILILDL